MNEPSVVNDVQTLIKEGNVALLAGDTIEARQRFRRALDLDPENVEALVGMAGAVRPYREKRDYLLRAFELDPTNDEARASLEVVEKKLAAGELLAPQGVMTPLPAHLSHEQALSPTAPTPTVDIQYCYIHPNRETGLQCTQCHRPICAQCMVRAPVGQLCPECARARRPANYQVSFGILAIVAILALLTGLALSFLVVTLLARVPFISFILAFFLAPLVAEGFTRLLDRITKAKRGKEMQLTVGISMGLGATPITILILQAAALGFPVLFDILLLLLFMGILIYMTMRKLR